MTAGRALAFLSLGLVVACDGERAAPIPDVDLSLRVTVGATEVEPGTAFPVEVVRVWRKGWTPAPFAERALSPLVLRAEGVSRREDAARVEETLRYRGWAFTREDVAIAAPRMRVEVGDGVPARESVAEPIRLRVRPTVDAKSPGAPEGPGDPPLEPAPLWPWIVGGIALAALVGAVVARRRAATAPGSTATAPTAGTPSALERALERLRAIESRPSTTTRADVLEGAAVVREYVAERFPGAGLARTSEEVIASRAAAQSLGEASAARLRSVLGAFDAVKFAGASAGPDDRARMLGAAIEFVAGTASGSQAKDRVA